MSIYEKLKKYEVKAESVEDFCDRFHKRNCFHERGKEYVECDLNDHKREFERYGFTMIPPYSSVTGDIVAYFGKGRE